ncbi:MAG: hypothetical protein IKU25_08210 [Clostridia bacterium]|nr:hypothetical protein [Clostridia bacterium]
MELKTMLKLGKALKVTAKAVKIAQLVLVSFATYKAIKLACMMVDSKSIN